MPSLPELTPVELISAAFFMLTAALLLLAMSQSARNLAPFAAAASILSIVGANGFLLMSYAGESPFSKEWDGPLEFRRKGEPGYLWFKVRERTDLTDPRPVVSVAFRNSEANCRAVASGPPSRNVRGCPDCPDVMTVGTNSRSEQRLLVDAPALVHEAFDG